MALDINKVKERLQKIQSKGGSSEKIDYKKLFFKPQLGKQTIRLVPNKFNKDFPFTEVIFHNQNVFKKSVYSLENWGEKDPVMLLRKELYNDSDAESKELSQETAKKLAPRSKAFAQVIVRGREAEGVLLWELNKTTYEAILNILSQDDEYGDITDIMDGTDLVVEGYSDSILIGKKKVDYVAVNITPKRKTSALSEDEAQIEKWLENQKNPLDLYKKYSYEEIKTMLKVWLDPESADNNPDDDDDTPTAIGPVTRPVPTPDEENTVVEVEEIKQIKTSSKSKKVKDEDDDDDDAPFEKSVAKKTEIVKGGKAKTTKDKVAEMFGEDDD